mmetsp:Transcript_2662/g.4217  ORF Transcript_2662/g.4217 Transcript_2662/m.4217 type:complete len:164 (-) Transcript_2662:794-1285(-)
MGYGSDEDSGEDDLRFDPPPRPVLDAAKVVAVAPRGDVVEHAFAVEAPGATLHFQIIQMRDQLYVWVGAGGVGEPPMHGELSMALKTRMSDTPAVTTLLGAGGTGGGGEGVGMTDCVSNQVAQRLAKRTGKCVVASCNIPADLSMLQVFAEKTLLAKLKELGL